MRTLPPGRATHRIGSKRTMTRLLEFPPLAKTAVVPQRHACCPTHDF